jgi:hypothetical protein
MTTIGLSRQTARNVLNIAGDFASKMSHFRGQLVEAFGRDSEIVLCADNALQQMLIVEDLAAGNLTTFSDDLPGTILTPNETAIAASISYEGVVLHG